MPMSKLKAFRLVAENRLLANSESSGECLLWQGTLHRGNHLKYGRVMINGVVFSVHRLAHEIWKGPVKQKIVCHTCDIPHCINPNHLFLGTHQDNMNDMVEKGRQYRPIGEMNTRAKLSESDVVQIRGMLSEGLSQPEVASIYGVSQSCISRVVTGKRWKHIN